MYWKKPHIVRVYEALTAVAEKRIELVGNRARCYTMNYDRYYDVEYDPNVGSIMSNDKAAYFTHTLSYQMIAMLMVLGKISVDRKLLNNLVNIYWEEIYKKYNNDYDKSLAIALMDLKNKGGEVDFVKLEVNKIYQFVNGLKIKTLGEFQKPTLG